jgi:hypothetical protein
MAYVLPNFSSHNCQVCGRTISPLPEGSGKIDQFLSDLKARLFHPSCIDPIVKPYIEPKFLFKAKIATIATSGLIPATVAAITALATHTLGFEIGTCSIIAGATLLGSMIGENSQDKKNDNIIKICKLHVCGLSKLFEKTSAIKNNLSNFLGISAFSLISMGLLHTTISSKILLSASILASMKISAMIPFIFIGRRSYETIFNIITHKTMKAFNEKFSFLDIDK